MDITLNSAKSRANVDTDLSLPISLERESRLFPETAIDKNLDVYGVYQKERKESNLVRLMCTINPICSNPLFNKATEIVKYEGSSNCQVLNYDSTTITDGSIYGKASGFTWDAYEAVRDTQLSNKNCGYTYHCGYDIFNNHIIRSKYFKTVNRLKQGTTEKTFNTIDDKHRIFNGERATTAYDGTSGRTPLLGETRMYSSDDVFTFQDSISNMLSERHGWFGFYNKTNIMVNELYDDGYVFQRMMNNNSAGDFIEMYPDSSLYSFVPKYNYYRQRVEKNWKYYVTYPSTSTTDHYYIDQETLGLRALSYDEKPSGYNNVTMLYSISKHGLSVGDTVNIYVDDVLTYNSVKVITLGDGLDDNEEYVFGFNNSGEHITPKWVYIDDSTYLKVLDGYTYYQYGSLVYRVHQNATRAQFMSLSDSGVTNGDEVFIIDRNRVPYSFDNDLGKVIQHNISYKKVSKGSECDYYIRIFTKVPNWKFANEQINYETANNIDVIRKYIGSDAQYNTEQFSSSNTKLAFSRNIFNDAKAQIVFLDDIDLSYLKDNLGRPISDLYLTLVKNNKGYNLWYENHQFGDENVEYSHCFGKVTGGFINSYESLTDVTIPNVVKNSYDISGMSTYIINTKCGGSNTDEVLDETQYNFYGDLCCFDRANYLETPICDYYFRFNTAQRECVDENNVFVPFYDEVMDDSAISDSTKYNGILLKPQNEATTQADFNELAAKRDYTREGYIYKAHYKIPIHGFSEELEEQTPKLFTIDVLIYNPTKKQCTTNDMNYVQVGDELLLYNMDNMHYATVKAKMLVGSEFKSFEYEVLSGDIMKVISTSNVVLLKPDVTIPSHAVFVNDGTFRYIWRHFVKNGTGESMNKEELKFANGRFYSTPELTFYLRRQDPFGKVETYTPNGLIINSSALETVYIVPEARKFKDYNFDWYVDGDFMKCQKADGE